MNIFLRPQEIQSEKSDLAAYIANTDRNNNSSSFSIQEMKLKAHENSDSKASRKSNQKQTTPVPTTLQLYNRTKVGKPEESKGLH